jgi:hypothetical protein
LDYFVNDFIEELTEIGVKNLSLHIKTTIKNNKVYLIYNLFIKQNLFKFQSNEMSYQKVLEIYEEIF